MNWGELELQYRQAALASATPVGVIVMLYDQLVKDLRKAAAAIEGNRPEECASEMKHALLVIQQLEGSIEQDGSDLVNSLVQFYSMLRVRILEAQVKRSAHDVNNQIDMILGVRDAWQQVEDRNAKSATSRPVHAVADGVSSTDDYQPTNWSA